MHHKNHKEERSNEQGTHPRLARCSASRSCSLQAAPAAPAAAAPDRGPPRATAARRGAAPRLPQPRPADPVKGKTIGFINAGPDDYYAQFGKTLKAVAEARA